MSGPTRCRVYGHDWHLRADYLWFRIKTCRRCGKRWYL